MEKADNRENSNEIKLVVAVVSGILILFAALFVSYRYSQTQSSGLLFPAGSTYLGQSPTPINNKNPL